MLESELLIEKLRHQCVNDEDFDFYEAVFDPNLRISILGFSLGGLRALASFLQEPAKYHTCIVFNSGVELALLNTEFLGITKAQWKDFLDKLNQKVEDKNDELEQQKHWKCFSGVFLGGLPGWLKERLKKNSHKLLFILSGGDEIVPPKIGNLEVAGHGLTVFKIAGVGHVPTIDPQWSPWLVRIADVIFHFVSKTGQEIFSHQDIVGEFAKLLKGTSYYATLQRSEEEFGTDDLRELLACLGKEERVAVLKLYYASMAYYPRFRELLNDLSKWKKREKRIESANLRNGA